MPLSFGTIPTLDSGWILLFFLVSADRPTPGEIRPVSPVSSYDRRSEFGRIQRRNSTFANDTKTTLGCRPLNLRLPTASHHQTIVTSDSISLDPISQILDPASLDPASLILDISDIILSLIGSNINWIQQGWYPSLPGGMQDPSLPAGMWDPSLSS